MTWQKSRGTIWNIRQHLLRPAPFERGVLKSSGRRGDGTMSVSLINANTREHMHPRKNRFILVVWAASNWIFVFNPFLLVKRNRYINHLICKERRLLPLELQFNLWYPGNDKFTPNLGKLSELENIPLDGMILLLLAAQVPGPSFCLHDHITSGFFLSRYSFQAGKTFP